MVLVRYIKKAESKIVSSLIPHRKVVNLFVLLSAKNGEGAGNFDKRLVSESRPLI